MLGGARRRTVRVVLVALAVSLWVVAVSGLVYAMTTRGDAPTKSGPTAITTPVTSPSPSTPGAPPSPTNSGSSTPECTPDTPLVDPEATPEARCLAARLDGWLGDGVLGIGQQLNLSSQSYLDPVRRLAPRRVALVGFDLEELEQGEGFGFRRPPLEALLDLAASGTVLTASWHTGNPATGADARDRSWTDLAALFDPTSAPGEAFWRDYDAKLELLRRLQTGDDGRHQPAAVLFRPLHEANGDWFWWGKPDPATYRSLWAAMQERAAEAGVHNIVWGWSANVRSYDGIADPLTLVPGGVDLVGIDTYDPVGDGSGQADPLDLTGLAELAATHPRAAITEVGPHGSVDGAWDPRAALRSAAAAGLRPAYALFWFDDGDGADGESGLKQLSSLKGAAAWLAACDTGVCPLTSGDS